MAASTSGMNGKDCDKDSGVGSSGGDTVVCIFIPFDKTKKYLPCNPEDTVWFVKQTVLAGLSMELMESFNYGLYYPPEKGRAGKFMDEERCMKDYPLTGSVGHLELKYKSRVYRHLQEKPKKLALKNSKEMRRKLISAVTKGKTEKVKKLTDEGLDPNYIDPDSGETPMTTAATVLPKPQPVMLALIAGGAHLDFRNSKGLTAMHCAAQNCHEEAIKALLSLGSSTNYQDEKGLTPVYHCIMTEKPGKVIECVDLLLFDHANVDVEDDKGWTPLHQVCKSGRVQLVDKLIYYGADIDRQNSNGNTPLHICTINSQEECARMLLFRGAKRTITNSSGHDARTLAGAARNDRLEQLIQNYQETVPYADKPERNKKRRPTPMSDGTISRRSGLSQTVSSCGKLPLYGKRSVESLFRDGTPSASDQPQSSEQLDDQDGIRNLRSRLSKTVSAPVGVAAQPRRHSTPVIQHPFKPIETAVPPIPTLDERDEYEKRDEYENLDRYAGNAALNDAAEAVAMFHEFTERNLQRDRSYSADPSAVRRASAAAPAPPARPSPVMRQQPQDSGETDFATIIRQRAAQRDARQSMLSQNTPDPTSVNSSAVATDDRTVILPQTLLRTTSSSPAYQHAPQAAQKTADKPLGGSLSNKDGVYASVLPPKIDEAAMPTTKDNEFKELLARKFAERDRQQLLNESSTPEDHSADRRSNGSHDRVQLRNPPLSGETGTVDYAGPSVVKKPIKVPPQASQPIDHGHNNTIVRTQLPVASQRDVPVSKTVEIRRQSRVPQNDVDIASLIVPPPPPPEVYTQRTSQTSTPASRSVQINSTRLSDSHRTSRLSPGVPDSDVFLPPPPPGFMDSVVALPTVDSPTEASRFSPAAAVAGSNRKVISATGSSSSSSSRPMISWTTDEVIRWLDGLQMGEHRAVFAAARIDGKRLVQLDNDSLFSLGVTQLGQRMILDKAIQIARED